jgi:hypothetical protein
MTKIEAEEVFCGFEADVCDPAIGSGAFPVGMMTEIVRARNALSAFLPKEGRSNYSFKREAIQNCLYGVDIDCGHRAGAPTACPLSVCNSELD